ncbi:MAG: hypothetical protein ABS81_10540 [Pseudonocardia sp. SCN 72-86]|nr:MAG: hypothetical protein ABS81_10540 [Pseudonocardia sp. SCN 72-86]
MSEPTRSRPEFKGVDPPDQYVPPDDPATGRRAPDPWPLPEPMPTGISVMTRWRREITLAGLTASAMLQFGAAVVGMVVLTTLLTAMTAPPVRRVLLHAWNYVVVPHRVRVGLVSGRARNRQGQLPLVHYAVPEGAYVRVEIGLRQRMSADDVARALSDIRFACGAAEIRMVTRTDRPNRVTLLITRPRWGHI